MINTIKEVLSKALIVILSKIATEKQDEISKAQQWIDNAQLQFDNAIKQAKKAEEKFDEISGVKAEEVLKLFEELKDLESRKQKAIKFGNKLDNFLN